MLASNRPLVSLVVVFLELIRIFLKTQKQKIVLVCNSLWYLKNFREDLILSLSHQYEVVLITPIELRTINFPIQLSMHNVSINRHGLNPWDDFKTFLSICRILKLIKPDLIINFTIKPNIYGGLAASFLNIPYINNITGLGTSFLRGRILQGFVLFLYRISHLKASSIIVQNQSDQDLLVHHKVAKREKIALIPGSGVDVKKFSPTINVKKKYDFLMVARIIKDKGVQEYLDASNMLTIDHKNLNFGLVGEIDSENPNTISQKEIETYPAITYLGRKDNIPELINQSDCIVLPSLREGLAKVLIEAGACEKICITSDVPGCSDVIIHGVNGFLCRPKNANSLVEAMRSFIKLDQQQKKFMEATSRKIIIEKFSSDIIVKKIKEIVEWTFKNQINS